MKNFSATILFYGIFFMASAQTSIPADKIVSSKIPGEIKFKGKFIEGYHWKDDLGENLLITAELGPYHDTMHGLSEEELTKELFAYHFFKKDSGWKLLWKLNDLVRACGLDMTAEFIKDATRITDLDKDNIAETVVQYALGCAGDVSPADMKLIMHEDTLKFALRGQRWNYASVAKDSFRVTEKNVNRELLPASVRENDYTSSFGRYETEKEFKKALPVFLNFARKQWLKYAVEKYD